MRKVPGAWRKPKPATCAARSSKPAPRRRTTKPTCTPEHVAGCGSGAQQRVVGLIGCPGAGKTTYARRFDPLDGWVHLTLDDFRQAMWPPHRQVYWHVRMGRLDRQAEQLLHHAKQAALETALAMGFNVVMADTHLTPAVFARELAIVASYGITIEWKLLDVSWEVLEARNRARGVSDPTHCQPDHVMKIAYDAFRAPDAWWRTLPLEQLEIIKA